MSLLPRKWSSCTRAAMLLVFGAVALTVAGCQSAADQTAVINMVRSIKPEERDKALAELTAEQKAETLQFVYGDDMKYISIDSGARMFESEANFIYGVLAPLVAKYSFAMLEISLLDPETRKVSENAADIVAQFKKGPNEPKDQPDLLTAIHQANMATVKTVNGPFIDKRVDALKKRLGSQARLIDDMDPTALRDLIWDDNLFEKFMADDKFAVDYMSQWVTIGEMLASYNMTRANAVKRWRGYTDSHGIDANTLRDALGPAGGTSSRTGT